MGSRLKKSLKVLSQKAAAALTVYKMKATVVGTEPAVWRDIQVDGEFSLASLHAFLQDVFGWKDKHLHRFIINNEHFMDRVQSRKSDVAKIWDEDMALCFLELKKGSTIVYEYDFESKWQHQLVVEEVSQIVERDDYEMILDGDGACIPEGCGGIAGYKELLQAYSDKKNARHKEAVELLGKKFDPAIWVEKEDQLG